MCMLKAFVIIYNILQSRSFWLPYFSNMSFIFGMFFQHPLYSTFSYVMSKAWQVETSRKLQAYYVHAKAF